MPRLQLLKGPRFDATTREGAAELESFLQCHLSGRILFFRLDKSEQGLVLRGLSRTYYAKQLAQEATMAATDLRIVANNIEVD
jgi:hypothetical protein